MVLGGLHQASGEWQPRDTCFKTTYPGPDPYLPLQKALPGRVPAPAEGVDTSVQESNVSAQRVQKELGLALRPVQETLVDAARSLLALASAHLKQEP